MKDIQDILLEKLIEYGQLGPEMSADQKKEIKNQFESDEISVKNFNILKVRDSLFGLGAILEENLNDQYYITTVKSGLLGMNEAVAIVFLHDDIVSIAAYSKEGFISQNTAHKAIIRIRNRIEA